MQDKKLLIAGAATTTMLAMDLATRGEAAVMVSRQQGKTMASGKTTDLIRSEGYEPVDLDRVTKQKDGSFIVSVPPVVNHEGLPNRLSIDRSSPYYTNCGAYVGVKFNGEDEQRTIEFSVSGGWIRRGKNGVKVTMQEMRDAPKEYGKVEVFWRSPPSRQVRRQIARMAR